MPIKYYNLFDIEHGLPAEIEESGKMAPGSAAGAITAALKDNLICILLHTLVLEVGMQQDAL